MSFMMWEIVKKVNIKNKNVRTNLFLDLLHFNELWEGKSYCPDCNTRIAFNIYLDLPICYGCLRLFTKDEIVQLDAYSKICDCGTKISQYSDLCETCSEKSEIMDKTLSYLSKKLHSLIPYYTPTDYCYHSLNYHLHRNYKERDLKNLTRFKRILKIFEWLLKNYDTIYDLIIPNNLKSKVPLNETITTSKKRWAKLESSKRKVAMKLLREEYNGKIRKNTEIPLNDNMIKRINEVLLFLDTYCEVIFFSEFENKNTIHIYNYKCNQKPHTEYILFIYEEYYKLSFLNYNKDEDYSGSIHLEKDYWHFTEFERLKNFCMNYFFVKKKKKIRNCLIK